jgi:hypothetical protein
MNHKPWQRMSFASQKKCFGRSRGRRCPRQISQLRWFGWACLAAVLLACLDVRSQAAIIQEDFATNPLTGQWKLFGDSSLFVFDAGQKHLKVIWDSSRSNSYFYLPLGTILNRQDDFGLSLDLELVDVKGGVTTNKPSTFELGFGFMNIADATKTNFFRGNSAESPDLLEFDYFPDTGFGPTLWPSIWSTNSVLNYNGSGDYAILSLPTGITMHVTMNYWASNQTLITTVSTNGISIGSISSVQLSPWFSDFRLNAFAIESYSDSGQDPHYGGSLLAHGTVDKVVLQIPAPPVQDLVLTLTNQMWQVSFFTRTNWVYCLERSTDLNTWSTASAVRPGTGARIYWQETNALALQAFYRVLAARP